MAAIPYRSISSQHPLTTLGWGPFLPLFPRFSLTPAAGRLIHFRAQALRPPPSCLLSLSCLCTTVSETRSAPLVSSAAGISCPTQRCLRTPLKSRGAIPSVRLYSSSLPAPPTDPSLFPLHAPSFLSRSSPLPDPVARKMLLCLSHASLLSPDDGLFVAEAPAAALLGCLLACGFHGAWDTRYHKRGVRRADSRSCILHKGGHTNDSIDQMHESVASKRHVFTYCMVHISVDCMVLHCLAGTLLPVSVCLKDSPRTGGLLGCAGLVLGLLGALQHDRDDRRQRHGPRRKHLQGKRHRVASEHIHGRHRGASGPLPL